MEKLKSRLKELVESLDYYLYDITYEKEGNDYILRVMIENDTFINIDDCIKVSKFVSEELDVLDPFKDPYMFEVTSAGAKHELRNNDGDISRILLCGKYFAQNLFVVNLKM